MSKHYKAAANSSGEVAFAEGPHPSVDQTGRYPTDATLRACGFSIWARPAGLPAVWVREGRQYTQPEAERIVAREQAHKQPST